MNPRRTPRPRLVYTPEHHIPIGEAVFEKGTMALRIKKHGEKETETITVDTLISLIFQAFFPNRT